MKKITCCILTVALLWGMGGCAAAPAESTADPSGTDHLPNTSPESTAGTTGQIATEPLTDKTLQVSTKEIYFTCPAGWDSTEGSNSQMLSQSDECMIAVCYDWHNEFDGNLEGLIEFFSPRFINDACSYCKGDISASSITATSTNIAKVNDYDAVAFSGTVSNKGQWDCNVLGYVLAVNDVRLMVIGIVSTQEQDPMMIDKTFELTSMVAASVRTEE